MLCDWGHEGLGAEAVVVVVVYCGGWKGWEEIGREQMGREEKRREEHGDVVCALHSTLCLMSGV